MREPLYSDSALRTRAARDATDGGLFPAPGGPLAFSIGQLVGPPFPGATTTPNTTRTADAQFSWSTAPRSAAVAHAPTRFFPAPVVSRARAPQKYSVPRLGRERRNSPRRPRRISRESKAGRRERGVYRGRFQSLSRPFYTGALAGFLRGGEVNLVGL